MAKLSFSMLALTVVMATVVKTSWAQTTAATITCYECTSVTDSNCGSPFKGSGSSATCQGTQCVKVQASDSGVTVVSRSCTFATTVTQSNTCTSASLAGATTSTCYCQGNNCNSASGLYPGAIALASALTMAFFGRRLL